VNSDGEKLNTDGELDRLTGRLSHFFSPIEFVSPVAMEFAVHSDGSHSACPIPIADTYVTGIVAVRVIRVVAVRVIGIKIAVFICRVISTPSRTFQAQE